MKTTDYPKTLIDPVITEVRRHKQEIAEAFGFDVVALGRSLQRRENGDPRFKAPQANETVVDNRLPAPSRSDHLDYNP